MLAVNADTSYARCRARLSMLVGQFSQIAEGGLLDLDAQGEAGTE
jgi:hypothetical protein